jgi:hypothetical protein
MCSFGSRSLHPSWLPTSSNYETNRMMLRALNMLHTILYITVLVNIVRYNSQEKDGL